MRILGIDPGTQYLGAGVIEHAGVRIAHVDHALFRPRDFDNLPDKLAYLYDSLTEFIAACRPDAVAIENVFHGKNARSAIILAHARAAAILAAAKSGLPVFEYAPSQVKRAVGASGQAPKEVIVRLVCAILGLSEIERADCADALAIAICHLNRVGLENLTGAAGAPSRRNQAGAAAGQGRQFQIVRREGPAPQPGRREIIRRK